MKKPIQKKVGKFYGSIVSKYDLIQSTLAEKSNVTPSKVSAFCSGTKNISGENFIALMLALPGDAYIDFMAGLRKMDLLEADLFEQDLERGGQNEQKKPQCLIQDLSSLAVAC